MDTNAMGVGSEEEVQTNKQRKHTYFLTYCLFLNQL